MAEPHGQLMRYKKRRRRPSLFLRLRARGGEFRRPGTSNFLLLSKESYQKNHLDLRSKDPWHGTGFAALAASRFPPDGEAASGGHISFCEERNVGKKVA